MRSRAALLTFLASLLLTTAVQAQDYEYLQNDDLEYGSSQQAALTVGSALAEEWLAVRLTNEGENQFVAEQIQFVVASIPDDELRELFCTGVPLDTIQFEVRIWTDDGELGVPIDSTIFEYPAELGEAEATVNAVTIVPLDTPITLNAGQTLRVGIRFPDGNADPCNGMLMQDTAYSGRGLRNLLYGTVVGCPPECEGMEDLCGCSDCEDEDVAWRDFNGDCSDDPIGVGASGDLSVRLAHEAGVEPVDDGPPDDGPADVGVDTAPDVGADTAADIGGDGDTDELTITRVSPSMGPSNLDLEIAVTGTGFTDALSIRVGPSNLEDLVLESDTLVRGTLLAGTPVGTYDVVGSQDGDTYVYANGFAVTDAEFEAPNIDSVEPNSAAEGQAVSVTITGANFQEGADVLFGARSGTNVRVLDGGERITVLSPTSLLAGTHDVVVENPDGQSDVLFGGWLVTTLADTATPDEGCCSVGGGARGAELVLLVMGAVWLSTMRRVRRKR